MKISRVWAVYFSPTGNVKEVTNLIAKKLSEELSVPLEQWDFTLPDNRKSVKAFEKEDLVVFGTPVYAGRDVYKRQAIGIPHIICRKTSWNIHALRTRHTISTSGTRYFDFFIDLLFYLLKDFQFFFGQGICLGFGCDPHIFLYLLYLIHSR